MKETWKPVNGYEGIYQVSNRGVVRSLDRKRRNRRGWMVRRGQVLSLRKNTRGYPIVALCFNCSHRTRTVHRLVAEAFIPNPENLPEVNHKNGIKADNRADNLEWVTSVQNMDHAVSSGLRARGDALPGTKLRPELIPSIRARIAAGESLSSIGRSFGVDHSAIKSIKTGRSWRYVK